MLKNKKIMFFLLALNSFFSVNAAAENQQVSKYDKLYGNMVKNLETGKSNEKNYKLIEEVLNKRNKELKDLYKQSDYIVKPEFLEWQIFASAFYTENNRGYDDKKNGGSSKNSSSEINGTDLRTQKMFQIGATIPMKTVSNFTLSPEINVTKKQITVENVTAPTAVPKLAPVINIPNVALPTISISAPSPVTAPFIVSPDIKITSTIQVPEITLDPISVVNFNITAPSVCASVIYCSSLGTPPVYPSSVTVTGVGNPGAIAYFQQTGNAVINADIIIDRNDARGVAIDEGAVLDTIYTLASGRTITMNGSQNAAIEILGTHDSYVPGTETMYIENQGTIIGNGDGTGTVKNQAAFLFNSLDSSSNDTRTYIENDSSGRIILNAPESVGIQLRPDPGVDDVNSLRRGIVEQGVNEGDIVVNGYRSYGMMTAPLYYSSVIYPFNDGGHFRRLVNRGSVLVMNSGTITVNGDESSAFSLQKEIQTPAFNGGTINIGMGAVSQNADGNLPYYVNAVDASKTNMVERAMGLFSNVGGDALYPGYLDDSKTQICNALYGCGNGNLSASPGTSINIGGNATQSSGIRVEDANQTLFPGVGGSITNFGNVNIYGPNNYGIVVNGAFSYVSIGSSVTFTSGPPFILGNILTEINGLVNVQSNNSIGVIVKKGTFDNNGRIITNGINSLGIYGNNGRINSGYGNAGNFLARNTLIETNGTDAHAVVLDRDKGIANGDTSPLNFYNQAVIRNKTEGTIGIYANGGATFNHIWQEFFDPNESGQPAYLVPIATASLESRIDSASGAIGIYVEGNSTEGVVSAPIYVGGSTSTYTGIGVYSDGDGKVTFNSQSLKASGGSAMVTKRAELHMGSGTVGLYTSNGAKFSDVFVINSLDAFIGNNSVLAYLDNAVANISNLDNVHVQQLGANSALIYGANYSEITIDNNLTIPISGGIIDPTSQAYTAENSTVTLNTGKTLESNTKTGLSAFSKDGKTFRNGTPVAVDKTKTGVTNKGTITMNAISSVGAYTLYGKNLNDTTGTINISSTANNGVGMYSEEEADLENNGTINLNSANAVGIFGKGDSGDLYSTTDSVQIINTGNINLNGTDNIGISADNNKTGAALTDAVITNNAVGANRIYVNGAGSVGIYAPFATVNQNGNIELVGTDTVGVYGTNGALINGGGVIDLNTASQAQIAYYLEGAGTKLSGNLGDIKGHGIAVLADGAVIDNSIPTLDLTTSLFTDGGDGKIALVLQGNSIFNYTNEIKVGDSVDITSDGIPDHYAVALYTDNQNLGSGIGNTLTAGANGVGIYAQNGSNIKYSGTINVGDGTTGGTGIYIGTTGGAGSVVTLDNAVINFKGTGGIGAYVDNLSTLTFGANSTMNFSGDGVGIYGVQGAVINDNGGIINSNGYAVERTRVQGGIININVNTSVPAGTILGHAVNGEINVLPGVTVTASGNEVIGIFGDGVKAAGAWIQPYEANNLGTIDFSNSDKATAIYLNNARGENKGTLKVNNDSIAFYGQGTGTEIYNNGVVEVGSSSVGLYGNNADIISNLFGSVIQDKGVMNTGIYNVKTAGITAILNDGTIDLGDDGVGIYAEKGNITNTGIINVGNKVSKNSIGIYSKDSTLNNTGSVKVGDKGIAFYGDNSILNLNSGNIDISNNGTLAYGVNNASINYNLGNKTTSENTFVYLINSDINFNGADITVADNGLAVYQEGTSLVQGYNTLNIGKNATGIYGYATNLSNNGDILIQGNNSIGIVGEDSNIINNTGKIIKTDLNESVGIYSLLKTPSISTSLINNGEINISGDKSIGIYATTLDSAGTSLGTTALQNNDKIILGNASDINNAIIGIYGTEGVNILNGAGSQIVGGNNAVGIYSEKGNVIHDSTINLGDGSVGVYISSGTGDINSASNVSVGNNGAVALYVNAGGTITNYSSNISVGSDSVLGYSKDAGTLLDNKGNLSIGTESVGFYSSGGEITNTGTLTSTGDGVVFFYGNNGKITNSGQINGGANNYGAGIYGKNSEIKNTANIVLGNSMIMNPSDPSDPSNRYAVGIYGDHSQITNSGNIDVGVNGIGIYSYAQSGDIINDSGAIISSNGDKTIGILAEVGNNKKVINNGQINLGGRESIGIALNNGVILENNGQVKVTGDESIGILATKNSKIYNSGIIDASGNNTMAVLLKDNSELINTGTINLGSGTLGVVYDTTSNVSGYAGTELAGVSVKLPSIASLPTYQTPSIVNSGIIKVGAKFEVPLDGVVKVKVDPSTVRTPTTAEVSALSDLSAKFLVSNSVKFIAPEFNIRDVTITPDFTQGTSAKTYKLEDVFMPSLPGGGINSGIASVISQSYTWDATPITNSAGNVDIWMQKIEYGDLMKGYWYEDFGRALDEKYENAEGEALKIFNKIDLLENEGDFKHIMSGLGGNIYANINQREDDITKTFENAMDFIETSQNNTKENVKVNIIGGKGKTNEDTDGVVGYDYTTAGVLGLREVERTYKHTFGYSLGYLHTGFEFNDGNESEEWVDTVQLGIHSKYTSNDWKLRNDLTGRVSFHNVDRNLDWPSPTGRSEMNGTYETYSITSDNILGKEFALGKNTSVTPYGALRAMYVTRPAFEEEGLERLQVEGNDAWSVKPRAGIELKAGIPLGPKTAWQLKGTLDFAYEYELADMNEKENARLVAIEDGYHQLAKPEEEDGQFRTRASFGFEAADRYGIFLNGEYSISDHGQDEYRAGMTLKAVF